MSERRPGEVWAGGHFHAPTVPRLRPLPAGRPVCVYLGEPFGLRDCASCRGTVRIKIYECHHPAHAETTLSYCRTCPDYQASTATDS